MNDDTTSAFASTSNIPGMIEDLDRAAKAGALLGKSLATAFEGLAIKGKSLSDVMGTLALSLSQAALKSAFQPLQANISSMFMNFASSNPLGFARGGAFHAGLPIPFAQGGVIANPMTFPLADGRTGLAGERGAEAIMPLTRGPDGRLGVAASGGAAASNITINISTPDAESFRRSETQMAAMLSRAVSLGQRNL